MSTLTADERRRRAREEYNATLAGCPGHAVLDLLAEKWTTLLLEALADGPRRHAELATAVSGATQKMLTQSLRRMERSGLVTRTVTPSVPVRVDYALTDLGRSLFALQRGIREWGAVHITEIVAARERYDGQDTVNAGL